MSVVEFVVSKRDWYWENNLDLDFFFINLNNLVKLLLEHFNDFQRGV